MLPTAESYDFALSRPALFPLDCGHPAAFDGERELAVLERQRAFTEQFPAPTGKRGHRGIIVGGDAFQVVDGGDDFGGDVMTLRNHAQQHLEQFDDGGAVDRRRQARVPLQTDVICDVGSRNVRGMSWNLSRGGMQVDIGNLKAADTVRLSFRLPVSATRIDAFGVVVWASETRQGIQFTKMSAKNAEAIQQFIADVEKPD